MGDGGITQVKAQTQLKRRSNATGVKAQPKQFRTQGNAEQINNRMRNPITQSKNNNRKTESAEANYNTLANIQTRITHRDKHNKT